MRQLTSLLCLAKFITLMAGRLILMVKKTPYVKTNYALRGLAIPAGKHTIDFVFDPASMQGLGKIARYINIFSVLLVLFCLFMVWRDRQKSGTDIKA